MSPFAVWDVGPRLYHTSQHTFWDYAADFGTWFLTTTPHRPARLVFPHHHLCERRLLLGYQARYRLPPHRCSFTPRLRTGSVRDCQAAVLTVVYKHAGQAFATNIYYIHTAPFGSLKDKPALPDVSPTCTTFLTGPQWNGHFFRTHTPVSGPATLGYTIPLGPGYLLFVAHSGLRAPFNTGFLDYTLDQLPNAAGALRLYGRSTNGYHFTCH